MVGQKDKGKKEKKGNAIPLQYLDLKCIICWCWQHVGKFRSRDPPGNLMLVIEITNEHIQVMAAVVPGILLDLKICMQDFESLGTQICIVSINREGS